MKELIEYDILQQIEVYKRIFDIVRIINPTKKKVIKYKEMKVPDNVNCYPYCLDNRECKDCILKRALESQENLVKIQHNGERVFLIFIVPIESDNEIIALELIKDITEGIVLETFNMGQSREHELRNMIQDINALIMKDPLTNIYNRRYIDEMLPREIERCSSRIPLSIAIMDIDYFKKVNDTYGHGAGDIVIKKVARMLLQSIRYEGDWVGRYGGEEFLICLPNTNNKKAYRVLERIRKTIEKSKIIIDNKKVSITASFGLCTIKNNDLTATDVLKCVDDKLYQAKSKGRNKVVI
ncbi:MAG: GGDEF domain-containing protein [Epulopiscium sp.]|nr:GGDEF domain-containing protein [Candidatus Epulonipiscium sp.]